MRFHTFGNPANPVILLIHGVLTPWQIWEKQISYFQGRYYIIVPALDAHVEEESSEYLSLEEETQKIEQYLLSIQIDHTFAICGLSLGGAIANRIFERHNIYSENLILDGAPLYPINKSLTEFLSGKYIDLIIRSKKRDPETLDNIKRDFVPGQYLNHYLKFIDTMTERSIQNLIKSAYNSKISETEINNDSGTRILFLHGTHGNEFLAQKAASLMKQFYPQTVIQPKEGYKHAQFALFSPDLWINCVNEFLCQSII